METKFYTEKQIMAETGLTRQGIRNALLIHRNPDLVKQAMNEMKVEHIVPTPELVCKKIRKHIKNNK